MGELFSTGPDEVCLSSALRSRDKGWQVTATGFLLKSALSQQLDRVQFPLLVEKASEQLMRIVQVLLQLLSPRSFWGRGGDTGGKGQGVCIACLRHNLSSELA